MQEVTQKRGWSLTPVELSFCAALWMLAGCASSENVTPHVAKRPVFSPPPPRRLAADKLVPNLGDQKPRLREVPVSEFKKPFDELPLLSLPAGSEGTVQVVWEEEERKAENVEERVPPVPLLDKDISSRDRHPLDLSTALQLAGANNLQIALAAERLQEAMAQVNQAEVLWVPTLHLGIGYNRHDGQIQDTRGDIVDVSRQSLFLGGGPVVGDNAPLSGAAGGPARFFVGLNPAEAYFAPLAARQFAQAIQADHAATFNDTLLEVGLRYYDLVNAQMRRVIAEESVANFEQLLKLAEDFVQAGTGLPADAARVRAQLQEARANTLIAERDVRVTSAELARLLRLDPTITLYPAEPVPLPMNMISTEIPLPELISQGMSARPELARHQALVAEALAQSRLEKWRPLVPNVFVGTSAGGFGGGPNGSFGNFEGRNDFDALAVWEVRNFGLGNRALQQQRASQQRQQLLDFQQTSDRVAAEVTQAYYRADLSARQVEETRAQVTASAQALPLNFRGILGGELRVIEAQQAIRQLVDSREQYLQAVIDNNQAQLQLLRAIGIPPESPILVPTNPVPHKEMEPAFAPAPK